MDYLLLQAYYIPSSSDGLVVRGAPRHMTRLRILQMGGGGLVNENLLLLRHLLHEGRQNPNLDKSHCHTIH